MSQQLQLTVGGVDMTRYGEQGGYSISQNWSRQGDTASFLLRDEHPARNSLSFTVGPLAQVVFKDVGLGQTLFSGVVTKPQVKQAGPTLTEWQLQCVDWTYLSDRAQVVGDFSNMTADQVAIAVTQQANCGIVAAATSAGGFVAPGPMIPRVTFNYDTLTAAWTKISKLASLSDTYGWYVDEALNLRFYPASSAISSGWTVTDSLPQVLANPATCALYLNDTMAYEWDATSIRNMVTVRGADFSSQQTDLWVGNGSQVSFPLTFTPDAANVDKASLNVGGVSKTVSAETGTSATTQWAIVGNAGGGWFLVANTDPAPASPTLIQFTYPYLQPVVSRTSDPTSIARFKSLPNGGQFGYYIGDTSLPNLTAAQLRGRREVATYSQPTERAQIDLPESFTGHFRAGQTVQFANAVIPDSQNNMVPGISARYLIVQNRINGSPGLYRAYQTTCARIL